MDVMRETPDKFYDLAVVDPPFGLNFGNFNRTNRYSNGERHKANKYKNGDWDKAVPTDEYWDELFRISKNQIVCGGNYFPLPPTQCFVFWYKQNPVDNFSDGELIWTSFQRPALCFDYRYFGNIQGNGSAEAKIHPTQKPIKLYDFLFKKFASPGTTIFDSHLGSGSIAISSHYAGMSLTACEIDSDIYHRAIKRVNEKTKQIKLFEI